ncbi:MAG: acetate--CoA ligase family protein, partial [Alphaproteobacteria bacterium]
MAEKYGKPVVVPWNSPWREGPGSRTLAESERVSIFRSTGNTFATIAAWLHRDKITKRRNEPFVPRAGAEARAEAKALLDGVAADVASLTERESRQILAAYGVPVTQEKPVAAAVVIRNMAPTGIEMMIGARRDPQFGPLVMVGLGGVWVEVMGDTAYSLAPVSPVEAREMIESLKSYKLLTGFRDAPAADIDGLVDAVCRVSELAADLRTEIAEIDVNPILVGPTGCMAVDALVVRGAE